MVARQPSDASCFREGNFCRKQRAGNARPYNIKKREQKSPFTLFWHSCGLAIQVFLVLEGVPGVLDIIIVVQGVQQLA
uniref:hypothetical protein n=1 Tax=Gemmiger formicilis TaxID=745368 RepID=UPI004029FFAD